MTTPLDSHPLDALGFPVHGLKGQIIVINGGGSGLGAELARILSRLGARVMILDQATGDANGSAPMPHDGYEPRFFSLDIRCATQIQQAFLTIRDEEGPVDVLINQAGMGPVVPLHEMDATQWDAVLQSNLNSSFNCIRMALQDMKTRRSGTIVNLVAVPAIPYMAAYAASTEALCSLVHSLAGELRDDAIHVIAYHPGMASVPGGETAIQDRARFQDPAKDGFYDTDFNSANEELISIYDGALSLAYLIIHAPLYHNQRVAARDILPILHAHLDANTKDDTIRYDCDTLGELLSAVRDYSRSLLDAVASTDSEFNKLPFFVRTMARNSFKRKVGVPIHELQRMLNEIQTISTDIIDHLTQQGTHPDLLPTDMIANCLLQCSRMVSILQELAQYYRGVPEEMTRFIRDEAAIRQVMLTCREREDLAESLRGAAESTRII